MENEKTNETLLHTSWVKRTSLMFHLIVCGFVIFPILRRLESMTVTGPYGNPQPDALYFIGIAAGIFTVFILWFTMRNIYYDMFALFEGLYNEIKDQLLGKK